MTARDLTLNIAVNLGRLSKWAVEKKEKRVEQFLNETQEYINELEVAPKSSRFDSTFQTFKNEFHKLKSNVSLNDEWAEEALTWANILAHRAKLA